MRKLTKAISALLVVVMLMSVILCAPFTVSAAETFTSGDYEYTMLDDGTAKIKKYKGNQTGVVVPSELNGYKVTSIGDFAFSDCESLTSITIPDSVTSIGNYAFFSCESLTSITIPDSVTSIGGSAFAYCESLTSITIPDSVTSIGGWAFSYCTNLSSITIPDSVTSIGASAFAYCESLTSITIPDSVTSIGGWAFSYCTNLSSITIPNGVRSIGDSAFVWCVSLTSITIPNGVRSIGGNAFDSCRSLTSITIPDSVTSIGYDAFYGCNDLIIYGYMDSTAQKYAKENGFIFRGISLFTNRQVELLCNNRITVYQSNNGKYKASENAKIEYNGKEYQTNSFGVANLPNIDSGSITVSKNGYITRTLTAEQLKNSKNIYLEAKNDNAPVITAVWVDNTDVLHDSYPLDMTSKDATTIKAEVDWGNYSYGSIRLYQDGKTAYFSGDSLSMVISDKFDTSNTITLIAADSHNKTAERELLIQNGTVNNVLENLNGASFDFNDSISLTLPDSTPLIGGMNVGVGLSSIVPVTISADNGKVYVAIGADIVSRSYTDKSATNKATGNTAHVLSRETKTFIDKFKDTGIFDSGGTASSVKKLKNFKQTYKDAIKRPQGKFGVEADFTVIGFAEGTFDSSGKVTWIDTGMILNPSVSVSKDIPFSIGPVPLYFEVGVSADVLGQLNLRLNEQAKNFVPNGEISGTLSLNGGVGVGVKKVLYAGGGLEGSLMPDWKINVGSKDYFKLKAKLKAYAKAGIACFEAKKTWDLAEKTLVEYPSKKLLNSSGGILDDYDFYDASNYKVKNLSYLDNNSSFISDYSRKNFLTSSGNSVDNYVYSTQLKTNIYKESTPQYVVFEDGTKLAVWLDSDSSNINDVCLYYSYFNGSSWSTPEKVYNDGTVDYAPDIVECSGKVYLVWQNATRNFDDNSELTLDDIAKDFDISVAVFDENHQFTTKTFENNNLDMQPVVCANGDNAYIAWINNGQNDWFGNNEDNSILISSYSNGSWSEPEVIYNNLNSLDSIAIDYNEGINVAYCMDMDGDINTTEDLKVYENGTAVSDESQSANSPQYCNHKLFWHSNNNIISSDIASNESGNIVSDRYQIIYVNGKTAVVFCKGDGLYSKLNVSYLNTETNTWGNPRTLVDNNTFIGSFSVAVNNLGNIEVLVNSCNVTGSYEDEDPYGTATLMLYNEVDNCDLSISELLYDESTFCADNSMNFDFSLTNEGSTVINGTNVIIKDESGKVLSTTYIEDTIVPGETIESSASYIVGAKYTSQKVSVYAEPKYETDVDLTDNTQNVELSYENICVENLTSAVMENGNIAISADIVNYGYQNAENICVKLIKDSIDGNVVATRTIDNINSLDLQTLSFEVNDNSKSTYFISIDSDADDYTADNSDFILINSDITYDIGDVNQDGNVDIKDATLIQFYISTLKELNSEQLALADTNSDGEVTIADATAIQKYLAGLVASLG